MRKTIGREERDLIANVLVANQGNVHKTARETHFSETAVRNVRKARGIAPLAKEHFPPGVRLLTPEDRTRALVALYANGGNASRSARETGLSATTISRYRDEEGIPALPSNPYRGLDPWQIRAVKEHRFWSRVDKGPSRTGCWIWLGGTSNGYGRTWGQPAHRVAFEFVHGPIREGHHLHHTCLNKACVRPAHLTEVTPEEHMRLERMEKAFVGAWMSAREARLTETGSRDASA